MLLLSAHFHSHSLYQTVQCSEIWTFVKTDNLFAFRAQHSSPFFCFQFHSSVTPPSDIYLKNQRNSFLLHWKEFALFALLLIQFYQYSILSVIGTADFLELDCASIASRFPQWKNILHILLNVMNIQPFFEFFALQIVILKLWFARNKVGGNSAFQFDHILFLSILRTVILGFVLLWIMHLVTYLLHVTSVAKWLSCNTHSVLFIMSLVILCCYL